PPVDAPLGTAAVPLAPLASVTSVSTVGLPRESRISRACIAMTVLILERTLPCLRLKSNHRRANLLAQAVAIGGTEAARGYGWGDEQLDGTRTQPPGALGEDLEGVVHIHRHDRDLGGDREPKRPVLERQQRTRAAAGPLREDHNGRNPRANRARGFIVGLERFLARLAMDRNVSGGVHRAAQQWNPEQLALGDEADRAGERGEQGPDVEHRGVI